ncbi:hypothetical protein [Effusibacillus dendaii]|uniref:Uncharacterized protein n=1 Tax=Effusibacillus dendaii TaxID=2743772 RepID=A0A7I8DEB0_9BACL|nr:hypothetical protein [Effusibacillus dendaii]BCJ87622.1 hypothetical protein skT53_26070 [Effusibacillus dendaii]
MPKKNRKSTTSASQQAKAPAPEAAKSAEPAAPAVPVNAMDVLKQRISQANKGGLLGVLNQVKNTKPEDWKDADKVKELAKRLATEFKLPVSEERLNQFAKAYKDATKGGQPQDPEELIKKYGQGKIDPNSINEFKKFIK